MNTPLPGKGTSSDVADGEPLPNISDHVLIRRIGKGAYGEVWLGQNAIGGLRAVKVIKRSTFPDESAYQRELKGLRSFDPISRSYAGFVQILQVGENAAAGYFYYVMELADDVKTGQRIDSNTYVPRTLTHELAKAGRLPLETSLPIGLTLAAGLAHLHAHLFIHRDIKPSNIIFVRGVPKLADIGLITEAGPDVSACGTLNYMPPELPGQPTGDIFSLGKVFYGLFMGMPCERFPDPPAAAEEFTTNPALRQLNNLILKACHHDPAQRFQTAHELHEELVSVSETVQGKPRSTGAALPPGGVAAGKAPRSLEEPPGPNRKERRKARWPRMAALLVLLLAIGGAVFFALKHDLVIVPMDTTAKDGVYDTNNQAIGASNAKEVVEALQAQRCLPPGSRLSPVSLSSGWAGENGVISLRPDLVIIHRSSFHHSYNAVFNFGRATNGFASPPDDPKWWFLYNDIGDDKLITLMGMIGNEVPQTKFLVYSRGTDTNWTSVDFRAEWVHKIEVRFPKLKDRIKTMEIPNKKNGTFRDPYTRKLLRTNVIETLRLPKKRELGKSN